MIVLTSAKQYPFIFCPRLSATHHLAWYANTAPLFEWCAQAST